MTSEILVDHRERAYALLKADATKILKLIKVQMDNLTMPQCPLYEEVLDTQMYWFFTRNRFCCQTGLVAEDEGKLFLENWNENYPLT